MSRPSFLISIIAILWLLQPAAAGGAQDELRRTASWEPPSVDEVHQRVAEWIRDAEFSDDARRQAEDLLADVATLQRQPLDHVARIIGSIYPATNHLLNFVELPYNGGDDLSGELSPARQLTQLELPHTARQELTLLVGRWYAQNMMFDEALQLLGGLTTDDVINRPTLLFYRGLCQHRLRLKDDCIANLERVLEHEANLPDRFRVVSQLMLIDIQSLEQDTLDEISRMMDDIHRRQALFRSGTRVRDLEREVIDKLDEMIEQLEQQQQQAASQASGQNQAAKPMQDSQSAGGRGDGSVTDKGLQDGGSWGDLPAQDRQAALAEMTKDLPPHYREVIEEYFRQLARMSEDKR